MARVGILKTKPRSVKQAFRKASGGRSAVRAGTNGYACRPLTWVEGGHIRELPVRAVGAHVRGHPHLRVVHMHSLRSRLGLGAPPGTRLAGFASYELMLARQAVHNLHFLAFAAGNASCELKRTPVWFISCKSWRGWQEKRLVNRNAAAPQFTTCKSWRGVWRRACREETRTRAGGSAFPCFGHVHNPRKPSVKILENPV